MLAAHLRRGDRGITRHLVRTRPGPVGFVGQPGQSFGQLPGNPDMHRLAGDPGSHDHLGDFRPGIDRAHCIQPLLDH